MSALAYTDADLTLMGVRPSAMLDDVLARSRDGDTPAPRAPQPAGEPPGTTPPTLIAQPTQETRTQPLAPPAVRLIKARVDDPNRPRLFQLTDEQLLAAAADHYRRTQGFRGIDPEVAFTRIPGLLGRTALSWLVTTAIKNPAVVEWVEHSCITGRKHAGHAERVNAAIHALAGHHYPVLARIGTTPAPPAGPPAHGTDTTEPRGDRP